MRGHVAVIGKRIGIGHLKSEAVGKDAVGVNQRERAVEERFGIDLSGGKAVGFEPERGDGETSGIFEVTALCLEVMRAQVHAFRPDDTGESFHAQGAVPICTKSL